MVIWSQLHGSKVDWPSIIGCESVQNTCFIAGLLSLELKPTQLSWINLLLTIPGLDSHCILLSINYFF